LSRDQYRSMSAMKASTKIQLRREGEGHTEGYLAYRFRSAKVTGGLTISRRRERRTHANFARAGTFAARFLYTVASLACNVLKITPRTSLILFPPPSLSLVCREMIVVYLRYPSSDLSRLLNCLDGVAEDAPKRPRGIPERAASRLLG